MTLDISFAKILRAQTLLNQLPISNEKLAFTFPSVAPFQPFAWGWANPCATWYNETEIVPHYVHFLPVGYSLLCDSNLMSAPRQMLSVWLFDVDDSQKCFVWYWSVSFKLHNVANDCISVLFIWTATFLPPMNFKWVRSIKWNRFQMAPLLLGKFMGAPGALTIFFLKFLNKSFVFYTINVTFYFKILKYS